MPPDINLSPQKQSYIEGVKYESHPLNADDIHSVAKYYQDKHGIKIFVQTYFKGSVESARDGNDPTEVAFYNIRRLQEQLKSNELIGYIHTHDVTGQEKPYVECFIIGKDLIIKPTTWYTKGCHPVQLDHYPNTTSTDLVLFSELHLSPQTISGTCAALNLAYLKQLLKNNAEQVRSLTISIPYLDSDKRLRHFFVPSPQVLAYSYSEVYNKYIKAVVMEDNPGSFPYLDQTFSFTTLKYKLEEMISLYQDKHNQRLREEASSLLKELPAFRIRWAKSFAEMDKKRAHMHTPQGNQTLAYTSKRFERLAILYRASPWDIVLKQLKELKDDVSQANRLGNIKNQLRLIFNEETIQTNYNELGRCLNKLCQFINKDLVFSTMFTFPRISKLITSSPSYERVVFLLEPEDRPILFNHLKKFLKFNNHNDSPLQILSWSNALNIPEHKKIDFVSDLIVDRLQFKKQLMKDLTQKEFSFFYKFFREKSLLREFLNTFIDESFLISELPTLSLLGKQKLKLMFSSDEAFQLFLQKGGSVPAKPTAGDSPARSNTSIWAKPAESNGTIIPVLPKTPTL